MRNTALTMRGARDELCRGSEALLLLLLLLTEAEEQAAGVGVGDDRLDAAREVLAVGDEEAAAVALGVHPAVVLPAHPPPPSPPRVSV